MSLPAVLDASAVRPEAPPGAPALTGRPLLAARVAWVALTALAVGLFGASLPVDVAHLTTLCTQGACRGDQLTPQGARALVRLGLSLGLYAGVIVALVAAFALTNVLVAVALFWRGRGERMALYGAVFLVMFGTVTFPQTLPLLAAAQPAWRAPVALLGAVASACSLPFFFVFPDGRFVPRWTRVPAALVVLWSLLTLAPVPALRQGAWPLLAQDLFVLGVFGLLVYAQVYRYRRVSDVTQRRQTAWVVYGVAVAVGGFLTLILLGLVAPLGAQHAQALSALIVQGAFYLFMAFIPLSLGVAILRYRLWGIDIIVNRTLVYAALTIGVVALYTLVVGGLGALLRARGSPLVALLATGLVAVAFGPLRLRLQRGVNRLLYGERDEPYAVLARLGQRLGGALAPDAVLPVVAETVAGALKLPYVAVALQEGGLSRVAAAYGAPVTDPLCLPLVYQGETVGQLVLAPRRGSAAFTPAERRLLDDLARQAGVAAHAVRLTADLQRSRERLVAAREEERRRLRRDLHDGLGPTLAGFTLTVGAVRNLLTRDPAAADALLGDLGAGIEGAVADIRRVAYALRPPALDEWGLVGAIRARASSYTTQGAGALGGGPRVCVEAAEPLPALPAAVEVAAYRIVEEALANVLRHARARTCTISLTVAEGASGAALRIEVEDDGVGLPVSRRSGVGLLSLRERAEELGGTCAVAASAAGGTRVAALLPLGQE
jgi:signal transduction histidine kinase